MSYIKIILGPLKKDSDNNDIKNSNVRELEFNNYALEIVSEKNDGSTFGFMYAVIYGGMRGFYMAEDKRPDFTFRDVISWIDNLPRDERVKMIKDVSEVMMSTQNFKSLKQEGESGPDSITPEEKKSEQEEQHMKT